MKAYLSGGMEHAVEEGVGWRLEMEQWIRSKLGHDVFNPNAESDRSLAAHGVTPKEFRKMKFDDSGRFQKIVTTLVDLDTDEIAYNSDYLVCYWDEAAMKGAGTKGELTMAKFFGKPVYLVTSMNHSDIPGWVLGCTTRFFSTLDEVKEFLARAFKTVR